MENEKLVDFFKEVFHELSSIVKYTPRSELIEKWKNKVLPQLESCSKVKMNRLEILIAPANQYLHNMDIDDHALKIAETILRDSAYKFSRKKSKESLESLKLLKAREENIDFELQLSEMICGDNDKFPYRTSHLLTEFFQNLGHNFTHNGETRKYWVQERLEELNIKEIHNLISSGLFKKKYFIEWSKANSLDLNLSLKKATNEFKEFIQNSITANDYFDLSSVLDMNINIELLFDNEAKTSDIELNTLIEEAKERFINPKDKQIALEKIWDAFERIKTYFSAEGLKKNHSASKLVEIISDNFDKDFMNDEFKKLTNIGNSYRIRHHEVDKIELTPEHTNYFFFRMLTLIDLCLIFLNTKEVEETNVFAMI